MSKNNREYNYSYQTRIRETLNYALEEYSRIVAIRVDLHFPATPDYGDMPTCFTNTTKAISRFLASLKAKLEHDEAKKRSQGKRVYANQLRYIWVRELADADNAHYHLLLIFNKDAYYHLGDYNLVEPCLRTMITTAWYSALQLELDPVIDTGTLVHYPKNARYCINKHAYTFKADYDSLIARADYLAKEYSKQYSSRYRSFGSSQY
ncbi:inovirus Gp2 family protein [Morganella sp. Je.2.23]|uniref:inovirus Gp2 family protein n=1 Tax=Morganella sp. Je.2.23 TaxID=3142840 RepID=UPI003DA98751